jgi:chemotaxis protein MotB
VRAMSGYFTKSFSVLAIALAAGACVSSSTHESTVKQLKACQASGATLTEERDACRTARVDLEQKLAATEKQRDDEKAGRATSEKKYAEVTASLNSTQQELDSLRKQKAEAEKRLAAQRALTERFRKMIDSGKIKIALRGGRMIMQLPSGVLFGSGKADLSADGKTVLSEVATVLKEFPDRKFIIAGHTDAEPLRGSKFKDNWELSTARSLTVTKYLITAGVAPTNLSAAGYGEFDPIGDNATDEGKANNRRIEIILVPNIEELPVDAEQPAT